MTKARFLSALAGAAFVSSIASVALAADPLDGWQPSALSNAGPPNLVFGNGVFLAPGTKVGAANFDLRRSTDGVTWTAPLYLDTGHQPATAFGYGNGTFVMGTGEGLIYSSTDGITWTNRYIVPANQNPISIQSVAYANGTWMVSTVSSRYYTSTDLVTWTPGGFSVTGMSAVAYALAASPQGTFVAATTLGIISFDGHYWTRRSALAGLSALGVSPTGLLAAGYNGAIATSPDGITWTSQPAVDPSPAMSATIHLTGVAYGSGGWVVVGNSGVSPVIYSSPDGQRFTHHAILGATGTVASIAFGDGRYVVSTLDTAANHASAYASGVYAPPVNLANAPTLNNPKPVVIPTAPTAAVHRL